MQYKNCSEEQIKFFEMIKEYPLIAQFWDVKKREVHLEHLKQFYDYETPEIKALTSFFATVWLGHDEHYFKIEFSKLIKNLDSWDKELVINWMKSPFFA